MIGEKSLLIDVVEKFGLIVPLEDDNKIFTTGYENFNIGNVITENISLMKGLRHKLLSISQFMIKYTMLTSRRKIFDLK